MDDVLNPENLSAFANLLVQAAKDRNAFLVLALALIAAVYLVRRFIAKKVPFFGTQAGGAVLTMMSSFAGALASSLLAGQAFSPMLALAALKIGFSAAGGWTLVKHFLTFWKGSDPAQIKQAAEEAGAAAAAAAKPLTVEEIVAGGTASTDIKKDYSEIKNVIEGGSKLLVIGFVLVPMLAAHAQAVLPPAEEQDAPRMIQLKGGTGTLEDGTSVPLAPGAFINDAGMIRLQEMVSSCQVQLVQLGEQNKRMRAEVDRVNDDPWVSVRTVLLVAAGGLVVGAGAGVGAALLLHK